MVTETIRAIDGLELEATSTAPNTVWVSPEYWSAARDKNLAILHLEVSKISGTDATVTIVAEDSSGRIFATISLTGNYTLIAKNTLRYVLTDFGANLKVGLKLSCSAGNATAHVSLEYTLKAY